MANHAHPHKYTEGTVLMSKGKQERKYALLPQSKGGAGVLPAIYQIKKGNYYGSDTRSVALMRREFQ